MWSRSGIDAKRQPTFVRSGTRAPLATASTGLGSHTEENASRELQRIEGSENAVTPEIDRTVLDVPSKTAENGTAVCEEKTVTTDDPMLSAETAQESRQEKEGPETDRTVV